MYLAQGMNDTAAAAGRAGGRGDVHGERGCGLRRRLAGGPRGPVDAAIGHLCREHRRLRPWSAG